MKSIWILDNKGIVGITPAETKSITQPYFQTRLSFPISTSASMSGVVFDARKQQAKSSHSHCLYSMDGVRFYNCFKRIGEK
jgi:hypothetical protein